MNGAGLLPAFRDYASLGAGYRLMTDQMTSRKTVHAYLFAGPKGVGKATFARYLAASLFCESEHKPCGECDACKRVFSGNEPDVMEILSPDGKTIPIDRIREVISAISQHSMGNGARVVILEPIEKLTPAAQNTLLKSLEEPSANVIFFLITHEPSAVLGTIASRCSLVKLPPWPDDSLRKALLALEFPPRKRKEFFLVQAGIWAKPLPRFAEMRRKPTCRRWCVKRWRQSVTRIL